MKKYIVLSVVVGLFALLAFFVYSRYQVIPVSQDLLYNGRINFVNVVSQVALSIFTFFAVLTSLWYSGLRKIFRGPELIVGIHRDSLHCVVQENPNDIDSSSDSILNVYAHVENRRDMVAECCQVSCNRIYAAIGADKFHRFQSIQAASFKWTRAVRDLPCQATIWHAAEMYFKVLQVVQQNSGSEEMDDQSSEWRGVGNVEQTGITFLRICLPPICGSAPIIDLPAKYDSVLLPLTIVAKDAAVRRQFVYVKWRGDKVSSYNRAGFLEVKALSCRHAMRMIAKGE